MPRKAPAAIAVTAGEQTSPASGALEARIAALEAELQEARDRELATAEILQVINSSPGDLAPVFDAIAAAATTLCGAANGSVFRFDGSLIHFAAHHGLSDAQIEAARSVFPLAPGRGSITARALLTRAVAHMPDPAADPEFAHAALSQFGTALSVPMLHNGQPLGAITVTRNKVEPFVESQIDLLKTFADQAVIAIENTRLITETREALEQQTATAEVLQVINASPGELAPVFDAMLEKAMRLCEAQTAHLLRYEAPYFTRAASLGVPEDFDMILPLDTPVPHIITRDSVPYRVLASGAVVHVPDVREDESVRRGAPAETAAAASGIRTVLFLPLLRERAVVGCFVMHRMEVRPFSDKQIALLENFAAQAVIAMENARLITETREARDDAEAALRDLKAAQANLIQAEKMASLGQLTAGIAHEIKNPLNFVNNFADLSVELLDELKESAAPALASLDADARADIDETVAMLTSNLAKIAEHGRRADGIVRSMLEHSRGASGERRSVDLNALVEEALNLAYHGARAQDQNFNITLEREFEAAIAPIDLVPQDVTRVFLNLIGNGFYAANKRRQAASDAGFKPVLRVATRELGDAVEVAVRDNGIGIAPELRDKLFQPFFTTKPTGEGTGLGLSISYDIVTQQHGGTIAVDSELGAFTEFTVHLPRAAQDKRTSKAP